MLHRGASGTFWRLKPPVKPFPVYLRETPADALSAGVKASGMDSIGIVVSILFARGDLAGAAILPDSPSLRRTSGDHDDCPIPHPAHVKRRMAGEPLAGQACLIDPMTRAVTAIGNCQGCEPGPGEGSRNIFGPGQRFVQRQQVRVERFGRAACSTHGLPARPVVRSRAASAWHAPRSRSKRFPAAWIPPGRRGLPGCKRRPFPSGCPWRGGLGPGPVSGCRRRSWPAGWRGWAWRDGPAVGVP